MAGAGRADSALGPARHSVAARPHPQRRAPSRAPGLPARAWLGGAPCARARLCANGCGTDCRERAGPGAPGRGIRGLGRRAGGAGAWGAGQASGGPERMAGQNLVRLCGTGCRERARGWGRWALVRLAGVGGAWDAGPGT